MEGALGHQTYAQNLRQWVDKDTGVNAHWMMIPYRAQDVWDRIPHLPFSLRLSLRARAAASKVLSREELDCLYLHTQGLALCSLDFMTRTPTVISLDATPRDFASMATAYDSKPSTGLVDRLKSAWFRRVFSRAVGLIGMSNWVKESLVRDYRLPPDKVKVIPFGVDIRQWRPFPKQPAPGRRMRLLFVGGDFKRKGGYQLLDAFQQGLSGSCELDIVTGESAISPGNFVRVHSGLTPNSAPLKELYAQADMFLLPTQGDASPFAILEAMASGLPVVTTRVGALGELVQEGVSGYFVPGSRPQAIVDAVTALAADPGKVAAMGRAARLAVEQRFNAETNCKLLIAYLKQVSRLRPDTGARPSTRRP